MTTSRHPLSVTKGLFEPHYVLRDVLLPMSFTSKDRRMQEQSRFITDASLLRSIKLSAPPSGWLLPSFCEQHLATFLSQSTPEGRKDFFFFFTSLQINGTNSFAYRILNPNRIVLNLCFLLDTFSFVDLSAKLFKEQQREYAKEMRCATNTLYLANLANKSAETITSPRLRNRGGLN